jgi:aminoglycoside phosphotransferase (APT) family kinase protein
MHPDQLRIGVNTVRVLVASQFPDWAALPITAVDSQGTVNALFRIGDHLAARFPLRPGEVDETRRWLESEAEAAQELHGRTPFATPEPVAIGEPGAGFRLPWAIQTWLPGTTATEADPGNSIAFAEDLATFIEAVRSIDTAGRTFARSGRGGDLRGHDEWIQTCLQHSEKLLDVSRLRQLWAAFRELRRVGADVMTHGDLIPGNVLVANQRLAGVIDVGGLGPADPALDLVGAWHLLEQKPRQVLRERLGCDDLEWERGKAWAFEQSAGVVWYYADTNPTMSQMGLRTLDRIMAEPPDAPFER